jgi:hypothetical protein
VQRKHPTDHSTFRPAAAAAALLAALLAASLAACARPMPDPGILAQKSRALLELESCEYVYHDIVFQGKQEKFLGLLTTKDVRLLFAIDIRVHAGIDLAAKPGMGIRTLPAGKDGLPGLVIKLPPTRITGTDADESTIHQYFIHEYGITGNSRVNWLGFQDEIARAKERARADAVKRGLLAAAWDNAAASLGSFWRLAGFGEVRVEKTAGEAGDASAADETPAGTRTGPAARPKSPNAASSGPPWPLPWSSSCPLCWSPPPSSPRRCSSCRSSANP